MIRRREERVNPTAERPDSSAAALLFFLVVDLSRSARWYPRGKAPLEVVGNNCSKGAQSGLGSPVGQSDVGLSRTSVDQQDDVDAHPPPLTLVVTPRYPRVSSPLGIALGSRASRGARDTAQILRQRTPTRRPHKKQKN